MVENKSGEKDTYTVSFEADEMVKGVNATVFINSCHNEFLTSEDFLIILTVLFLLGIC